MIGSLQQSLFIDVHCRLIHYSNIQLFSGIGMQGTSLFKSSLWLDVGPNGGFSFLPPPPFLLKSESCQSLVYS